MPEVVQLKCPKCGNGLRIPVQWVHQPLRCKHCRQTFQARKKKPTRSSPAVAAPPPRVEYDVPAMAAALPVPLGKSRPAPRLRGTWWKGALLAGLVVAVAGGIAIALGPQLAGLFHAPSPDPTEKIAEISKREPIGDPPKIIPTTRALEPKRKPTDNDPFPRRALLISVNDYLFANPLHYGYSRADKGFPGSNVRALRTHLETFLHFPSTQCLELSDRSPLDPQAPLKAVLEKTIEHFLATSLPQDHVVLFFAGHFVEDEEKKDAFLVPIEGQLDKPETLVSLAWVYEQLKKSPARQKVLVLDVCRFDPGRGNERPGGDPMGKTLDALLQSPPDGVQVWSSCTLGQQSLEFEDGSLFLMALNHALIQLKRIQEHADLLPLEELVPKVAEYLEGKLARSKELKQSPRLAGTAPAGSYVFDPDRRPPRLAAQIPTFPGGAAARKEDVEKILAEINLMPPVRMVRSGDSKEDEIKVSNLPPFAAKDLAAYQVTDSIFDYEKLDDKFPFRAAVARTLRVLQNDAKKFSMKETFSGSSTAAVKKQVLKEQGDPGRASLFLEDALEDLKRFEEKRNEESSPRWRALYDFLMARLMSRIVYVTEYNYLLAQIRTDSLPELPPGASGYRVGSRQKVSTPEGKVKDLVKDIKRAWDKVEREHARTPWAIIAQRERLNALGLEWRATRQ